MVYRFDLFKRFFIFSGILFSAISFFSVASAATLNPSIQNCTAPSSWFFSTPSMPTEVEKSADGGTSSDFCDFYQFSWQAFLNLMGPSSNKLERNFEDIMQYPILEKKVDKYPANSCDESVKGATKYITLNKSQNIPERTGQAGDGATIYDQDRNVVYYDVRFSRNMCTDAEKIDKANNFPGGTIEIKTAWKVLHSDKSSEYITINANIGEGADEQKNVELGLIGFHVAIATPDHPEFVWATFEHRANTPNCDNPSTSEGWSFTSKKCAAAMVNGDEKVIASCDFNVAIGSTKTVSTPTEICRVFPYGTDPSDPHANENIGDVVSMNMSVVSQLPAGDVLKNYFNVGALWVSDVKKSSSISNQRGSLRLANTVAETTYQHVGLNPDEFISNCFGCHNYAGSEKDNVSSGALSHIFNEIYEGLQCHDVVASKYLSRQTAPQKCPKACSVTAGFSWNGQWTNTPPSGSGKPVCGCCPTK